MVRAVTVLVFEELDFVFGDYDYVVKVGTAHCKRRGSLILHLTGPALQVAADTMSLHNILQLHFTLLVDSAVELGTDVAYSRVCLAIA